VVARFDQSRERLDREVLGLAEFLCPVRDQFLQRLVAAGEFAGGAPERDMGSHARLHDRG
jgi:hypothetical protein